MVMAKKKPIKGTDGDDELVGTSKDDRIDGGDGDDKISGGKGGADILTGGAGEDEFYFAFKGDLKKKNMDVITDFTPGEDLFILDPGIFKHMGFGLIQETYFRVGKKAKDADDHLILDPKTNVLSYDADGKGGKDAVPIVEFRGVNWEIISGAFQNGNLSKPQGWIDE
jgi:Ca2+-binding RTX toxin-like protein